ncbi:phage tail protein [Pseudomonas aeruginosa]|uniref:phage tail protein n=1 Tax=Pseudomonas aeruginosa TaxID=287 RepID=UPI0020433856|nr:phage tail protein [Pseudomonas aeruginosa]
MTIFYSAQTGGFYLPGMTPDGLECVEISDSEHLALREQQSVGMLIQSDETGRPIAVDPPVEQPSTDRLCGRIDKAADNARFAVVGDPTRTVEYERSAAEAQAFADAGYPADAVPRTVAAWAINGRTAHQAADSILAEAAAYTEALYVIRETRLAAKEQIRTLMAAGEVEQAQQLAEQTVAAIEAAVAGVGNAAA